MKLQLLIPQFNETDEVVKSMLDSINGQQGIDLKENIEVLIGNDGSDIKLSSELINSFPYPIQYIQCPHSGCAGTRKYLFDMSSAEYVMFCDADDMFVSNLALYTIFNYIKKGFDALIIDFIEEGKDKVTQKSFFIPHKKDMTFVHGKVYRRQFLIDNNIEWHPDVTCHEDSSYNILAIRLAENLKYCSSPLYLWKWRDNSFCRSDPLYLLKTYNRMIYSNSHLVEDFLVRDKIEDAKFHACCFMYNTYFMFNRSIWLEPLHVKYRYDSEKCFQQYYNKYKELIKTIDPSIEKRIIQATKRRALGEGVILESYTFKDWIKHIEEL